MFSRYIVGYFNICLKKIICQYAKHMSEILTYVRYFHICWMSQKISQNISCTYHTYLFTDKSYGTYVKNQMNIITYVIVMLHIL